MLSPSSLAGAGQSAVSAVRAARKACLNKTFSMLERDSYGAEQQDLSNMQKVQLCLKSCRATHTTTIVESCLTEPLTPPM